MYCHQLTVTCQKIHGSQDAATLAQRESAIHLALAQKAEARARCAEDRVRETEARGVYRSMGSSSGAIRTK